MSASILVFRPGQLGDTLVALPAFWAVRRHWPGAAMTLLCDAHVGKPYVLAPELLRGAGVFDDFELYPVDSSPWGEWRRVPELLALLARLRRRRFDTLVYLAPSRREERQIRRDRRFFQAAGIRRFVGMEGSFSIPQKTLGQPLPEVPSETDQLLARLERSGVAVPSPGDGCMELGLLREDTEGLSALLGRLPSDGGQAWIGVGPGSKMPSKQWPLSRFAQVIGELVERLDVWPVILGGDEDRVAGETLIQGCGRGYNVAGALSLRAAAAALQRCALYVGNDSGTMHLAAAVKTPCVAVFSARDWPGRWHPYGAAHRVLRARVDCEGCGLVNCRERRSECLTQISAAEVVTACLDVWERSTPRQPSVAKRAYSHSSQQTPKAAA